MDTVTRVRTSVSPDRLDEALSTLRSIAPEVVEGLVERPGSDGHIGVGIAIVGDVRDAVRERLDSLGLEYQVDVGELGAP
ncbi:hypothetical protein [Streptomyces prunicolor]|uniref:hypothetical protein n=1 Tax=Streptomyces prunicolor TaxID=67348 RepID=UPI00036B4197|nr:hypothetical protein [Streptomyces prunicolor]